MTVEAWALAAVAAVFILAYCGARQRADRWESAAKNALDTAENMAEHAEGFRTLVHELSRSNHLLATLLGRAVLKLKEREDEADWWKKGPPE